MGEFPNWPLQQATNEKSNDYTVDLPEAHIIRIFIQITVGFKRKGRVFQKVGVLNYQSENVYAK